MPGPQLRRRTIRHMHMATTPKRKDEPTSCPFRVHELHDNMQVGTLGRYHPKMKGQEMTTPLTEPYAHSALTYLDSDLGWPVPSQYPFEKMPPLKGWTGKRGSRPDRMQVEAWCDGYPTSNLLLRVKRSIIGIDVDAYDDKQGAATLRKVSSVHGALPHTYKSSARGAGTAGIYFYRLHPSMDERKAKGDFGPGSDIEVVRYSHRYAVVYPSWHQGAQARYQWYTPGGNLTTPPHGDALPSLPGKWWKHLTQQCACFEKQREQQRHQLMRYRNRPTTKQGTALARNDFENSVIELASMPQGGRNNYLSKLAGRTLLFDVLINEVLEYGWVIERLWVAAETCGLDETETRRTIESAQEWAAHLAEEKE